MRDAQSWPYDHVNAPPLSRRIEDHLLAAVRKLTSHLSVDEVCEAILVGAAGVFAATASWILLHEPSRNVLRTVRYSGEGADVFQNTEVTLPSETIAALTFTTRQFMFVPDVMKEHRWANPAAVHASTLRSVLTVPLIAGDHPVGVLGVASPELTVDSPPTDLHLRRLELFAAQAAIGVTNARLYESSQHDRERMRALLRQRRDLKEKVSQLRKVAGASGSSGGIVGDSPEFARVLREVEQVASSDVTVLLLGETGTGKEVIARALHERGRRSARPFVAVNCAALPETLIESEMFGHERGAFTGAFARKPGRFELADTGTLFLDEIGDLPLTAQAKLLRVIQDGRVQRIGGTRTVAVNVRIVAATNQELQVRIADKTFREDLYYRLNVFPITLPPLRARRSDIPLLTMHFVARFADRIGRRPSPVEAEALDRLARYDWPGNIRELQNVVERAMILAGGGPILPVHVRLDDRPAPQARGQRDIPRRPVLDPATGTLAESERDAILGALRATGGRISGAKGAATLLGLKPTTLHAKMKKLGVRREHAFYA